MLKIGYNELPNFENIHFNQSRQGILFKHLVAENKIKEDDWLSTVDKSAHYKHPIEMKVRLNQVKAKYVDLIATKLLKEGAIYESLDKIAEGVVSRSLSNGGSTTYTSTGLACTTGYALAVAGSPEETYGDLTTDIVKGYIEKHYDNFLKNDGNFLGIWKDGGTWVLDVSEVILGESEDNKLTSLKLAKSRGEKAIYDLYNSETLYVDDFDLDDTTASIVQRVVKGKETVGDVVNLSNKLFK